MSNKLRYILIVLLVTAQSIFSVEEKKDHKTICVNMIVKNESKVITRCLASVKPIIDYWVIVDTGSTDGTQDIIKEFMKDVPGELHERPWKNFGHNRTEAIQLAHDKSDYVLIIDADEVLRIDPDFKMPDLDKDLYYINTIYGGTQYVRAQLVNNHLDWKWVGVLHEYLEAPNIKSRDTIKGLANIVNTDGARSADPKKYEKDAAILEEALKDDPNNSRNVFYLAQSYRDCGKKEEAIKNYERRVALGGWDQEVFWSMLQIAMLQEALEMPQDTVTASYTKAYQYRPSRNEPLYRLATYYRQKGNYMGSYIMAATGLALPKTTDILFVESWMSDYGLLLEYSISAYWVGRFQDAKKASEALLAKKDIPESVRTCVENNLKVTNQQLSKIAALTFPDLKEDKKETAEATK